MEEFTHDELEAEEWRPVPEFPRYVVSSLGRVRGPRGGGRQFKNKKGYMTYMFYDAGRFCPRMMHSIVATAFIGPRPEGYQVAHLDGKASNNRASNLAYKTPRDNEADKLRHGTRLRGENAGGSKLTDEQAREIKATYRKYSIEFGSPALAKKYGVHPMTIRRVALGGRHWKHI